MVMTPLSGVVLERDGGQFRVATAEGEVRAILRGKAKRGSEQVIVGDHVRLEPEAQGELYGIEGIEPRRSILERRVPLGRGNRPIAAIIDRLLVVAAANDLVGALVINKIDLDPGTGLADRYVAAGYEVLRVCV